MFALLYLIIGKKNKRLKGSFIISTIGIYFSEWNQKQQQKKTKAITFICTLIRGSTYYYTYLKNIHNKSKITKEKQTKNNDIVCKVHNTVFTLDLCLWLLCKNEHYQ